MLIKQSKESLIDTRDKTLVEGYLIVRPTKQWWGRIFKDKSHCSLMIKKRHNWLWFEASTGFFNVEAYPMGMRWTKMFPDAKIYHFKRWRNNQSFRVPHLIQPFTCVEAIKAFLGCNKWWIVTPNQLIKEVL